MDSVLTTINNVASDIQGLAPGLAGLIIVVIGLLWITAKDAQKKEQYQGWIINVLIGLGLVYLGASIVTWFTGKITGFE